MRLGTQSCIVTKVQNGYTVEIADAEGYDDTLVFLSFVDVVKFIATFFDEEIIEEKEPKKLRGGAICLGSS